MRMSVVFLYTLSLITTVTLAASSRDAEVLAKAQRLQLEFRQGNLEAVKPLVKTLEQAVDESANNAQLWEALGHAYMSRQGSLLAEGPDMPALIQMGERARAAYARSLALDADNAMARVSHGMAQMVVSQLQGDGPGMLAGVAQMDDVVRQHPKSTRLRLTRAFTVIHLPPAMRNTEAVIEDLEMILNDAPGGRPEDVLHLMLGDVHAEMGRLDAARAEYRQVTGASAFAAEQSKQRFLDLEKGSIPPAGIQLVRAGTGARCAMCHAPGMDN